MISNRGKNSGAKHLFTSNHRKSEQENSPILTQSYDNRADAQNIKEN